MPLAEIRIGDEFKDGEGRFINYDAIPLEQRAQLRKQQHVDIRLFNDEPVSVPVNMLYLDSLSLFELDQLKMSQINQNAKVVLREGEQWTNGTVSRQADRNFWHGISLACTTTGPNITQSVIV